MIFANSSELGVEGERPQVRRRVLIKVHAIVHGSAVGDLPGVGRHGAPVPCTHTLDSVAAELRNSDEASVDLIEPSRHIHCGRGLGHERSYVFPIHAGADGLKPDAINQPINRRQSSRQVCIDLPALCSRGPYSQSAPSEGAAEACGRCV